MVENLKLVNTSIDSSNSNLPVGKTVNIPASSASGWCQNETKECAEQLMTLDATDTSVPGQTSAQSNYGILYNWYTAAATYGNFDTTDSTDYSVCPKGWRLPTGGYTGEFQSLRSNYYPSSVFGDNWTIFPLNFVLSGYHYYNKTNAQGGYGRYWSSTGTANSMNVYNLQFTNSSVFASDTYGAKVYGLAIRCVNM